MSREIKFRMWDKSTKIMHPWESDHESKIAGAKVYFSRMIDDPDAVIMQFTGLLDKNGKEIYEDDIIKDHFKNTISRIRYSIERSQFIPDNDNPHYGYWPASVYIEIIGNIYENPELLNN